MLNKSYRRNALIFLAIAIIEVAAGSAFFCYSLIADGILCLAAAGHAAQNKGLKKTAAVITVIASLVTAYFSVIEMSLEIGYSETAPSLWAFPFFAAAMLAKIFMLMATIDDAAALEDTELKKYSSLITITIVTGAVSAVGILLTYLISMFYIESIIGLGIVILSIISAITIFKQAADKKEKKSKKAEEKTE